LQIGIKGSTKIDFHWSARLILQNCYRKVNAFFESSQNFHRGEGPAPPVQIRPRPDLGAKRIQIVERTVRGGEQVAARLCAGGIRADAGREARIKGFL
jgi:hypothetical protein